MYNFCWLHRVLGARVLGFCCVLGIFMLHLTVGPGGPAQGTTMSDLIACLDGAWVCTDWG